MSKFYQALEKAQQSRPQGAHPWGWSLYPTPGYAPPAASKPASITADADDDHPAQEATALDFNSSRITMGPLDPHLVTFLTPGAAEAEPYRKLSYMLTQRQGHEALNIIAVSSPMANDGKTIMTLNLAGALVQNPELRVLVIDADLRNPSMPDYLGLTQANTPGLVEALLDPTATLDEVVCPLPSLKLSILPAGRLHASPHEVLNTSRLGTLLADARQQYDYVLIDTPPVVPFMDCEFMSQWIDGFLLIATMHKTPRKLIDEALETIPDKLIGLVFNQDKRPLPGYNYHYYARPSPQPTAKPSLFGRRQSKA